MASTAPDRGDSHTLATLFLVIIVVLLAALVALFFKMPSFTTATLIPSFLHVLQVLHTSENGLLNYDSRVILINNGTETLENNLLRAEFYRNNTRIPATVETMNGYQFISTRHYGVERMWGLGCQGSTWEPKEKIGLDFSDRTFHPGDRIRVDFFLIESGEMVSSHSFIALPLFGAHF